MKLMLFLILISRLSFAESSQPSLRCHSENVADAGYTVEIFENKERLNGAVSTVTFAGEVPAYEGPFKIEKRSSFFGLFKKGCFLKASGAEIQIKDFENAKLVSLNGEKPSEWQSLKCSSLKSFVDKNKDCLN